MLEPLNELGFVQRQIVQRSDERHHDNFVRVLTFANANEKLPDKKSGVRFRTPLCKYYW